MRKLISVVAIALCSYVGFAQEISITVENTQPGDLHKLISDEDQKSLQNLKIIGSINATDIEFIRSLNTKELRGCLNLSETTIVSGGTFQYRDAGFTGNSTTRNNVLPEYMFGGWNKIQKVILPASIEHEEKRAFNASNIDSVIYYGNKIDSVWHNGHAKYLKFSEGIIYLNFVYYFHPNDYMGNAEIILPSTLKEIQAEKPDIDYSDLTIWAYMTHPEDISVLKSGATFSNGTIYILSGTTENYMNSIFKNMNFTTMYPVENIKFIYDTLSMYVGEQVKNIAQVYPEYATRKKVIYESTDISIASINDNGFISAINPGKTMLIAHSQDNEITDTCIVNAFDHTTGIIIQPSIEIFVEQTINVESKTLPLNTSDNAIKYSTSNPDIATVDENGNVKGINKGNCIITATSIDGNYTIDCTVTVLQPITGIELNQNTLSFTDIGQHAQLQAHVVPKDAICTTFNWKSSNENVCVVENGWVIATGYGTAVIIATTEDGNFIATCTVTVTDASGIASIQSRNERTYRIFNLQGIELQHLQKGVNILRFANGKTKKVLIK